MVRIKSRRQEGNTMICTADKSRSKDTYRGKMSFDEYLAEYVHNERQTYGNADPYQGTIILSNEFQRPFITDEIPAGRLPGNNNVFVCGGQQAYYTAEDCFVKPNLCSVNASYVIADLDGQLLRTCGQTLRKHGYRVLVFNPSDPEHSSQYNPIAHLTNEDEADCLTRCIFSNTQGFENCDFINSDVQKKSGNKHLFRLCFLRTKS